MQINSFFQKMNDGYELWVNRWLPNKDEDIKGIVQLHHGLAEHSMRYDRLGSVLAENGYILNAYDFRGHGKSAENAISAGYGTFGKIANKDGFNIAIEDLKEIIQGVKNDFPGKKVILLGHSFGSFVSQGYIEKYSDTIDACTLCGTSGPKNGLPKIGKIVVNIVNAFKGPDAISPLLANLAFGSYCKKIKNPKTPNDWISKNEMNVQMYNDDKWCGISLTNSFFKDLMSGLIQIHKKSNMKKISVDLPINFIYGKDDPVGSYGKSIEKLYSIYQKNGIKNLTIKAYPEDRHELFNEDNKEEVEKDLINWIEKIL